MADGDYVRLTPACDSNFLTDMPRKPQRGGARQNAGGKRAGAGRPRIHPKVEKPASKNCVKCGTEFPRQRSTYCVTCRLPDRCDHDKPRFANGRERLVCYECHPKRNNGVPRKQYEFKSIELLKCGNPECNSEFIKGAKHHKMYCSDKCRTRVGNVSEVKRKKRKEAGCYGSSHRRRAKRNGGKVERFTKELVFDRDNWRCQICGVDTPKELKGSFFHAAPELDHIVPLSRGGDHTKANSRCACRSCNQFKSNKTDDEMFALLAT